MKKFIKLFTLFIITLVIGTQAFAENFYIENYDVDIVVNKNKQAQITEDIDVFFTNPSHGLMRKIPFQLAKITGVNVEGNNFKTIDNPKNVTIRIGDPDKYVKGKKHYKITYTYSYHDNKNEFYHNIIGTDWTVPIKKVHFKVVMPENIDPAKTGLSIGREGTEGFTGGAEYKINGNTMTGETFRTLERREGVTVRTELPAGYFRKYYSKTNIIAISIMLLLTLSMFVMWYIFGKEDKVIPVVTFDVPKGVKNALEAEMFMKEQVTDTGIIALIIELAGKGYIKIEPTKKTFNLTKLKDWDGDKNDIERRIMTAIFGTSTLVQASGLSTSHRFYASYEKIMETMENNRPKMLYEEMSEKLTHKVNLCFLGLVFGTLLFFSGFNLAPFFDFEMFSIWATLLLIALGFYKEWDCLFTTGVGLLGGYLLLVIGALGYMSSEYLPYIGVSVLCLIIGSICANNMPKKTKIVNGIIGQLQGLKKYIQTAEKHQIEQMIGDNPDMFYHILPYAYVFGVSDIWMNHFKDMVDFKVFDTNRFDEFTHSIATATKPSFANGGYSSSDGSSSGGGSSYSSSSGGGGHSGGGGGGGGGSSW